MGVRLTEHHGPIGSNTTSSSMMGRHVATHREKQVPRVYIWARKLETKITKYIHTTSSTNKAIIENSTVSLGS
jgi:hypothetical protein